MKATVIAIIMSMLSCYLYSQDTLKKETLNEIKITSSYLERKGDRFIMTIANEPSLSGKNAQEVLAKAPGVWISDDDISVNGVSGTKIFINGRELKYSKEQLNLYLTSLNSDNIRKVEIIPISGAEYDAKNKGGIIHITLKKQLTKGISGNIQIGYSESNRISDIKPTANINSMLGKISLNVSGYGSFTPKNKSLITQERIGSDGDTFYHSTNNTSGFRNYGFGKIEAIYDINKKNSIAGDISYSQNGNIEESISYADLYNTKTRSIFNYKKYTDNIAGNLNYIYNMDTLGSNLKFLADITTNNPHSNNSYNFINQKLYSDTTSSKYLIASTELVLHKKVRKKGNYKVGVKYLYNNSKNNSSYNNINQEYSENIIALFGTYNYTYKNLDIICGLRGEYTYTYNSDMSINKSYFSLFPNLTLSYSLGSYKTWIFIAQYGRNITRPAFSYLDPNRYQISEYSYYVGNPYLKPTYYNNISFTSVYKYKYTFTIGSNLSNNLIRENIKIDSENPNIDYITPENHYMENHYYVNLNTPFNIKSIIDLNINLTGVMQDIKLYNESNKLRNYILFINSSLGGNLPLDFYIETIFKGHNRLYSATSSVSPKFTLDATIKKRFLNKTLILTGGIYNITNSKDNYKSFLKNYISISDCIYGINSRHIKFTISYIFKSGKDFKKKNVERGSAREIERIEKVNQSIL